MEEDIVAIGAAGHKMLWMMCRLATYIDDNATAELVARLARLRGLSPQDAVRLAVIAELRRMGDEIPLRERLAKLHAEHPLPPPTGKIADKAFFDELSGNL